MCWLGNEKEIHLFLVLFWILFVLLVIHCSLIPKQLVYVEEGDHIVPLIHPAITAEKRKMRSSLDTRKIFIIRYFLYVFFLLGSLCKQDDKKTDSHCQALLMTERTPFHKCFKYRSTPLCCPQFLLRESCEAEFWAVGAGDGGRRY